MAPTRPVAFVVTVLGGGLAAFVGAALVPSPDSATQLLYAAGALPFVSLLSYVLTYRGGYEYLRNALVGEAHQ